MRVGKKILINTLILTLTSLLMRTVGVSFHVFISNQIGASGVGIFQLIMSVYTLAVTVASSGIRLTTTKLVAEEMALFRTKTALLAVKHCLLYSFIFGLLSSTLLFVFAGFIGKEILGDARTIPSLYALSISLLPVALSSVLSGYFMAVRKVLKSASAQFFEQLIRIGIVVFGFGMIAGQDIERACLLMAIGGSIAEIISFLYQWALFLYDKRTLYPDCRKTEKITGRMLFLALPLAISDYARTALSTVEHILIPRKLCEYGHSMQKSLSEYGLVHGMVIPVLNFPAAFLGAFSSLLLPEIAECYAGRKNHRIKFIMTRVFQLTLIFSVFVSGVFFFFSKELSLLIYGTEDTALYFVSLSPLVIVMYLDDVVDAMLKGLNQQLSSMRYNLIDSFLGIVFVSIFIPRWGTGGYVAVIFLTESVNAFLSLNRLLSVTDFQMRYKDWLLKPILAGILSLLLAKLILQKLFLTPFVALLVLFAAMLLYFLILRLFSAFNEEDIRFFAGLLKRERKMS